MKGKPGMSPTNWLLPRPQVRFLGHSICLPGTARTDTQHGTLLFHCGPASPSAAEVTCRAWDWAMGVEGWGPLELAHGLSSWWWVPYL